MTQKVIYIYIYINIYIYIYIERERETMYIILFTMCFTASLSQGRPRVCPELFFAAGGRKKDRPKRSHTKLHDGAPSVPQDCFLR